MNKHRFVAILALSLPAMAQAASVSNSTVGCKAETDAQKVLGFMAKNDNAGLDKFKTSKITAGDCSLLTKGMAIAIDKTDGQFLCVRPTGALDCVWALGVAINQNPSGSEETPSSRPQGQGRGAGRHSPF
jgi:hypothetical protein